MRGDEMTIATEPLTFKELILREPRPFKNMTEIARRLGCSCEYVRQVAEAEGIEHRRRLDTKITVRCYGCGKEIKRFPGKKRYRCGLSCPGLSVEVTCLWCGKKKNVLRSRIHPDASKQETADFCSPRCFYSARSAGLAEWKAKRRVLLGVVK